MLAGLLTIERLQDMKSQILLLADVVAEMRIRFKQPHVLN
jgi:hypothetical protein|tara:strand:+ start:2472 stop:2591 length:120 start_codon:yes stop_codon:yes gene_type:complete